MQVGTELEKETIKRIPMDQATCWKKKIKGALFDLKGTEWRGSFRY